MLSHRQIGTRAIAFCLLLLSAIVRPAAAQSLEIGFDNNGLKAIGFERLPLLKCGQPRLRRIVWDDTGKVEITAGNFQPQSSYDERERRLEQIWSAGRLTCVYHPQRDRLDLELGFTNTSDRPIRSVEIGALHFLFPATPKGPGWSGELHCTADAVDDVAGVIASYGKGTVVAVSQSIDREFRLAFHKDFEHPAHGYYLIVATINRTTKDFIHADPPHLKPGESLHFGVSLRFGPAKSGLLELAGDAFRRYADRFPHVLRWPDRRPIAMLMLASVAAQHHSATNPRGWLNDPTIDVTTPAGQEAFRGRLLAWADRSVAQCRRRGAQGAIVWDVEGEEFQPIVYVGDPRLLPRLAPEMDAVADEFFKKFTDAGLRTGVCIRPSRIARRAGQRRASPWRHTHMAFDPVQEMADKIAYAKKRWGCSLFYVDTNVTFAFSGREQEISGGQPESWVMRAAAMRRLAELNPDVLIIPEFQYTGYYSHVSGYKELRGGFASTPERVLLAYPQAFSVINAADGRIGQRRAELVAAVKRGDILMFRGWFDSSENAAVDSIYREARTESPVSPPAAVP